MRRGATGIEALTARQIVSQAGMAVRPGAYSGRGATTSDVNDERLEAIYQGISQEHGEAAAKQFAEMVAAIPQLTGTDFLIGLYRLEADNWELDPTHLGNEKGVYPEGEAAAFGTVMSRLGPQSDDTAYIRRRFLERHEIPIPDADTPTYFVEKKN